MDTNKPEHKEAAHASVEAELEEVYAQLEEARAKLAEIKSRANTEEAPGDSVVEGAVQDATAQVDATTQAPQPDWTPYASVPPQTPPTVPPYEPPTYNQAPPQTPPQQAYYQQPYYQPQYVQTKDHVAAGLLAIFLGSLGIHKFYLGYNTAGFIMLAVTTIGSLLTFGLAGAVMAL
ncbi:MAG: NINE protein, partial [Raoultibacter sp.]